MQSVANVLSAFLQRQPEMVPRLNSERLILDANPAAERAIGAAVASLRGRSSICLGLSEQELGTWCIAIEQVHRSQQDQALDLHLHTAQGQPRYAALDRRSG